MVYFDGVSLIGIQGDEPTPQELLDAIPDATEVIAVTLPTIEDLMDIDESSVGQKEFTYQTLVWNYAASVHNTECAIQKCVQDFSTDNETDQAIAASLVSIGQIADYLQGSGNPLINGRIGNVDEALPLVVRTSAALESLSGAWRGVRAIFQYRSEKHKADFAHSAYRSAGVAASGWRALHESMVVESQPTIGPKMDREQMRSFLINKNGLKCLGCDRSFDDPSYLELDHKWPKSDGGTDNISNRQLLCTPCNRIKSNKFTLQGLRQENRRRGRMAA